MYAVNEENKNIVNTFIKMFSTKYIEIKHEELFKSSLNFVIKSTISLSSI